MLVFPSAVFLINFQSVLTVQYVNVIGNLYSCDRSLGGDVKLSHPIVAITMETDLRGLRSDTRPLSDDWYHRSIVCWEALSWLFAPHVSWLLS